MLYHPSLLSRITPLFAAILLTGSATTIRALDVPLIGDTWTGQSSSYAAVSQGGSANAWLTGATSGTNMNMRTWLKFDLAAAVPAQTTWDQVSKATLRVYANTVFAGGPVDVWAAAAAWDEATLTHSSATTAPVGDPANGNAAYNTQTVATVGKYYTFDVTELVRDWLQGTRVNHGIVLVSGNTVTSVVFDAKEATASSHPPALHVALTGVRLAPRGDVTMGTFVNGPQP